MLESANACWGVLGSTKTTQGSTRSKCMEVNEYKGASGVLMSASCHAKEGVTRYAKHG